MRLGRLPDPDPRDANFPLRSVLPATIELPPVRRRRDDGAWLNQGNTGTCVGHGWAHFVEDGPVMPDGTIDPFWIYRECCKIDPWSENDDGDLQFGTSTRAGAKVLQTRGIVGEYRHPANLNEALAGIAFVGPLVIGINWYDSMFDPKLLPDATGELRMQIEISPGSDLAGGHCLVANGYDLDRRLVRLKNSWGRGWGSNGRANVSFELFERLVFEEGGDCVSARQKVTT